MPSFNVVSERSAANAKDKTTKSTAEEASPPTPTLPPADVPWWQQQGYMYRPLILAVSLYATVWIRLQAVRTYGKVIHEFDPWFNYRSTKYLVDNGWEKFSNWYDYESWYPLGRPVGHTVYPGLMVTAAKIYEFGQQFKYFWSLNDVCVFIPAAFALITVLATYGLTYEVTGGSSTASTISAAVMAIIPAHLMRSVAGGFDNESVAVAAIVLTFYLWVRALRSPHLSWFFGSLCGLSYVYLVSAWGAYIFVLNMIGVHVGILAILMGRFNFRLHLAYSTFYIIGTYGALQFPTVGLQPLQSMEQMGPLVVFGILQIFALADAISWITSKQRSGNFQKQMVRFQYLAFFGLIAAVLVQQYVPSTFFGPLSARVRGLFVRHTKTGNPLVDSVAEHQQTPNRVYWLYFHWTFYMTPVGFYLTWTRVKKQLYSNVLMDQIKVDQATFLLAFIAISYYFSARMIRLVLLLSPATSIATGIVVEQGFGWAIHRAFMDETPLHDQVEQRKLKEAMKNKERRALITTQLINVMKRNKKFEKDQRPTEAQINHSVRIQRQQEEANEEPWEPLYREWQDNVQTQRYTSYAVLFCCWFGGLNFIQHSIKMSHHLSEPQIMTRVRDEDAGPGHVKIADDFREAYWWLRDNTPKDTRVMAWWDYGYQINGIAERTTLADGNTWNHEHIALLGRALVSHEQVAWETARHLADYVLVWSTRHVGILGDDLAKMPHMARIAGSVYDDVNASDYFFVNREGGLSNGMKKSMLYQVHSYGLDPDVPEPVHFEEAYTTKDAMVRIFKVKDVSEESKEWIKIHHTYPPALDDLLAKKQDFQQRL